MGDAAVGRKGEDYTQQSFRIVGQLQEHLNAGFFTHGLDFGCGFGRFTPHLVSRCSHLWAADIFDDWIRRAAEGFKTVTSLLITSNKLPLPDNSMDLIVDIMTLQSVDRQDLTALTEELSRVLSPGGTFVSLYKWDEELHGRGTLARLMQLRNSRHLGITNIDKAPDRYCLLAGTRL